MIERKSNSLGIEFNYSVAGTHQEYNDLAKRPNVDACLEDAVEHVVQHSMNTEFRDLFLHGRKAEGDVAEFKGIEQITGINRLTQDVKSPTKAEPDRVVTEYAEKEGAYFRRVCAELNKKPQDFADLAQQAANLIKFDPSASEAKPKAPRALPKAYAEKVAAIHAKGTLDKALKAIHRDIGKEYVATGDKTKDDETLGWLVKEHAEWVAQNKAGY